MGTIEKNNKIIIDPNNSFLQKLIDWKDFELFVAELYKENDDIKVEHNITETGISGAKRQTDVKVTHETKLHKYVTLIECKRWKKKVTRQTIDVLSASIEDLNASKGVIFTTKGYEKGAIEYAKHKNIDIFLVRDLTDNEWGQPGRKIFFYIQMFNAKMNNFSLNKAQFLPTKGIIPKEPIAFNLVINESNNYDEKYCLYANYGKDKGKNILEVLLEVRNKILNNFTEKITVPISNEEKEYAFETHVTISFENYPSKFLKHDLGIIMLENLEFTLITRISQFKFEHDRANKYDFSLIVENYINNKRNYVNKVFEDDKVELSEPINKTYNENDENDVLKNGSIFRLTFAPYIDFKLKEDTKIIKTNDVKVKLLKS
ncbi:MAG: restriction endonuclease [Candidatus Sericytochromatia bacterium]